MEFDIPVADEKFAIPTKQADILSEWDFGSKGLTEAEAKKKANFKYSLLKTIPPDFQLSKIIHHKGPVPALLAIYEKRPYFLYVTTLKEYRFSLAPLGRGVHVNDGFLTPNPHLSSYTWVKDGVVYGAVGNVSVDDLVKLKE
jgi:hypothetical protein